jgi:hypothetical protein
MWAILVTALVTLGGCGDYAVVGRVVQGPMSTMAFVPSNDPRLKGIGVSTAEIEIHRDATRPNSRVVARSLSQDDGSFDIPLAEFGAGWMVEEWRITSSRAGYAPADLLTQMPSKGDGLVLMIMMAPGRGATNYNPDPLEQFERFR